MKTIEIIVTPKGETRVETKGFAGGECREASKFVEKALGRRGQDRMAPEFYVSQPAQYENRQRN